MTIKTHRETERDQGKETHYCEFCYPQRIAVYWSQNEGDNYKPLGRVVWHCQKHRRKARIVALGMYSTKSHYWKADCVRGIANYVIKTILDDIKAGRVPERWDGIELRLLLADRFKKAVIDLPSSERLSAYENDKIENDL